jgi:cation diffusion facilitator family transporter
VPGRDDLTRYGWLSIAVALGVLSLKLVAWAVTGSVGLLSDALESTVNLVAAIVMLITLRVAARPPDEVHQFGHEKAELFSAAGEGLMILVAAGLIMVSAVGRLLGPRAVERAGVGLAISTAASLVNLAPAVVLLRAGRTHQSAAVEADARHLLTDVWTSAGVLVGVLAVTVTGWLPLDPLVAIAVAANIVITGGRLVWRSVGALMDPAFGETDQRAVDDVLARYRARGIGFHALRSRVAGPRRFLTVHVLVPGEWTVAQGHSLLEEIEADLRDRIGNLTVLTHLEPLDDPVSYRDQQLDR